jgi:hypothetical protein
VTKQPSGIQASAEMVVASTLLLLGKRERSQDEQQITQWTADCE